MLFQSGKNWATEVFLSRGWLFKRRLQPRRRPSTWKLLSTVPAECLEERILLSTITVTGLADTLNAGAGNGVTLRDAIEAANTDASVDGSVAGEAGVQNQIVFSPGLSGKIVLDSGLGELTISSTLTITGNGAANTIIDGSQNSRIFSISSSAGDVTLDGLTLENGRTTDRGMLLGGLGDGGAIRSLSTGALTIQNSILSGNSTAGNQARGGAIYDDSGAVAVTNSTLTGNYTVQQHAFGGAIYDQSGAVTIASSTLYGNFTQGQSAMGGAIFVPTSTVTVTNSTLTGNSATGSFSYGGAIGTYFGSITAINSTIVQNNATVGGGIATFYSSAALTLTNTILAQNTDDGTAPDLYERNPATLTITNSLIGTNTGNNLTAAPVGSPDANGNLIGNPGALINPRLGPLNFNGGLTPTMALLANSPAIDAGTNADPTVALLSSDQRGAPFFRSFGTAIDIGAYEFQTQALSLVVTSAADTLDAGYNPAHLTLRDAVALADGNAGPDAITFDPALNGTPIDLTGGQMVISETVTITGNGAANTIINAQHNSRIFNITGTGGDVTIDGLTLENGQTIDNGVQAGANPGTGDGGAIRSLSTGELTISNSTLTGNSASGNSAGGGAIYDVNGTVKFTSVTISGNSAAGYGGAIWGADVTATNSTLSGNSTTGGHGNGGAIASLAVNVSNSTLSGNFTSASYAKGGAIAGTSVTVANSTLSGNSTAQKGSLGGAIFDVGPLNVTNSTLSGNSTAGAGAYGGAIYDYVNVLAKAKVINSTIVRNQASDSIGGGLAIGKNATGFFPNGITIANTILAQNTDQGNVNDTEPDLYFRDYVADRGAMVTITHSLIGDAEADGTTSFLAPVGSPDADGNLVGTSGSLIDPMLAPLNFNGGSTQTVALLAGSPALDAGSNDLAIDPTTRDLLTTDQRGAPFVRNAGASVDIGAYESQSLSLVVNTTDDTLDAVYNPTHVTLRDAVALANANPGLDTITFDPSLNGTPIDLSLGQMSITDSVTITGNGAANTIIDAQHSSRILNITSAAGDVTLDGVTLEDGKSVTSGGAILAESSGTLTILNSTLTGNSTTGLSPGGAIYDSAGPVVVTSSTLSGNSTIGVGLAPGGAIDSFFGAVTVANSTLSGNSTYGYQSQGGAIFSSTGAVTITNSTLSGNSTAGEESGGGALSSAFGAMTVTNSTLSGNSTAGSLSNGGAIFSPNGAVVTNSTIVQNQAANGQGGGVFSNNAAATITLSNTILAQNTDDGTAPDLYAPPSATLTVSHSMIGDNTGTVLTAAAVGSPDANGNLIGMAGAAIDPLLGALANNGGPTQTMALLAGSPALAAGAIFNDASRNPITTDQRGAPRVAGGVDIGAYQSPTVGSIDRLIPATSPANANSVTFVVTFNEPVLNVSAGDFTVNAGSVGTVSPISSTVYDVTVNGLESFLGTLTLGFSDGQTITDAGGGALLNTTPTGDDVNTYVIEHTQAIQVPGLWLVNSPAGVTQGLASITQSGSSLTIVNYDNTTSAGSYLAVNQIQAVTLDGNSNVVGNVDSASDDEGRIVWSDGSVWLRVSLQGQWAVTNSGVTTLGSITQSGNQATLVNGGSTTSTTIAYDSADGQLELQLPDTSTVDLTNDSFTLNGQIWKKLDLPANYTTSFGGNSSVIENGNISLTFINNQGQTSPGYWLTPTQVVATAFGNEVGTVGSGQIVWSTGEVWTENLVLSGTKNGAAGVTRITATPSPADFSNHYTITSYVDSTDSSKTEFLILNESGTNTALFINDANQMALGTFFSPTQLDIPAWGVMATIEAGQIDFSNGLSWNQTDLASASPVVVTSYTNMSDGARRYLVQNGTTQIAILNAGMVLGTLTDATHFGVSGTSLTGTIGASQISFSNGSSWMRTELGSSGPITVASYVDSTNSSLQEFFIQNGTNTALFINDANQMALGTFVSPSQFSIPDWNVTATVGVGQITFTGGSAFSWTQAVLTSTSPVVVTSFVNVGDTARRYLVQNGGTQVALLNGGMVLGTLTDATHFDVPGTSLTGTIGAGQISFSNNSSWFQTSPSGSVAVSFFICLANGNEGQVITNGSQVLFVKSDGSRAFGTLVSGTTYDITAWGLQATISAGRVDFNNGSFWTQLDSPLPVVTLTDTTGEVFKVRVLSSTTFVALSGSMAGMTATRQDDTLAWSNGAVWNNYDVNAVNALFQMSTGYP